MRSKRGSAHFEMIMAFVFFTGVVLFLFLTLQPSSTPSLFDSVLNNMKEDFFEFNDVEFGSVFISVNYDKSQGCFYFDLPEEVFDFDYSGKGMVVSDLGGVEVQSGFNSGVVSVGSGENFFRVKLSEEFGVGVLNGCVLADSYELGSVIERDVVSYSKMVEMRDRYYSDYEGLKSDLKVPEVFDFGIVASDLSEISMLPENGVPQGVEVLARDFVFEVLRSDGTITNEKINFRVW